LALLQTGGTTPSGFPLLTNERERHEWLGPSIIRGWWYDDLLAGWAATRDSIRRACLADVDTWLAEDLFMKLDKMAMAHSLEGRAPYLYPPLARAAFDLPASQKIARGGNKLLLRLVARRLLPATICERRKQGFCLPMRRWLADFLKRESPDDLIAAAHLGVEPGPLMNYLESEAGGGVTRERLTYALLVLAKWAAHAHGRIAEIRAEQSRQSVAA
jgi:asparagine synthase (glutamine-hydrolysing)